MNQTLLMLARIQEIERIKRNVSQSARTSRGAGNSSETAYDSWLDLGIGSPISHPFYKEHRTYTN